MPEFYSENRLSNSDKGKFFIYGFFTCLVFISFSYFLVNIQNEYQNKNHTIELQKQTIYRLNNQLSKMDTLHDECFKMSEIRNAKK